LIVEVRGCPGHLSIGDKDDLGYYQLEVGDSRLEIGMRMGGVKKDELISQTTTCGSCN